MNAKRERDASQHGNGTDKAVGRTPGGINPNDIRDKDIDRIVPVSPDELELRDPSLTTDEEENALDQSGKRKHPL
jgi:hypothetical protein